MNTPARTPTRNHAEKTLPDRIHVDIQEDNATENHLHLSTVDQQSVDTNPRVRIQSARWVKIGSAPTSQEVIDLTRRDRPMAQARVLRRLGVPFLLHPTDGVLLVARAAAEQALGVVLEPKRQPEFEVDLEAIRNYGQTPRSH